MRSVKTRIMGTGAALLLGATFAASQGLDTNRTTIVTFSAPVALPGVTLPAGSYMFRLADSQTNRNIVQVFDKDRTKIFATILAVAAQRSKPADDTVITFKESPATAAPAVQYWYYPGETTGQEFAYPKKQAMEIANAAHTGVLAVDTESESYDATKAGEISRVEPGADMAQNESAAAAQSSTAQSSTSKGTAVAVTTPTDVTAQPAQPSQPAQSADVPSAKPEPATPPAADQSQTQPAQPTQPADMPSAKPQSSTPPATDQSQTTQPVGTSGKADADLPPGHIAKGVGTSGTLPHTASPLPLIGFAGVLALFAAAGLRALRKAVI